MLKSRTAVGTKVALLLCVLQRGQRSLMGATRTQNVMCVRGRVGSCERCGLFAGHKKQTKL